MDLAFDDQSKNFELTFAQRFTLKMKHFFISPRWLAILLLLAIWQIGASIMNTRAVPTPLKVASVMWEALVSGEFFVHLAASMARITVGFVATVLVGTIVGVVMGSRRSWESFFKDAVVLGLTMPGLIYALLAVMFFGLNLLAPVSAILFASYPFVAVNVREGVRSLDKDLLDMTRAYKVNRMKVVREVILPSLLPFFLAAVRTGFAIAWKVSTLVEVFGTTNGVGYMIRSAFDAFSVAGIAAWALLFGGVMLAIEYGILLPAERRLARWRPKVGKVI